MDGFVAYRLHFHCEARSAIALPLNKGSMLRGAFFGALRRDFCANKDSTSCLACLSAEACPICKLAATVDRENSRGAEVPRPFALEPIVNGKTRYEAGETFSFGLTLFGQALSLFPYVILAVQRMGEIGMGNRTLAPGHFTLQEIWSENPLAGIQKRIFVKDNSMVNVPDIPITHSDVLGFCSALPQDEVRLDLLTPMRLVIRGSLVQWLSFRSLMQRLLRRLTDLYHHCCGEKLELDFAGLLAEAEKVRVVEDKTRWLDLASFSSHRQTKTPIGGLVGEIAFDGNLEPFLPFLVWGQFTHVGKDVTRGNGWYQIRE